MQNCHPIIQIQQLRRRSVWDGIAPPKRRDDDIFQRGQRLEHLEVALEVLLDRAGGKREAEVGVPGFVQRQLRALGVCEDFGGAERTGETFAHDPEIPYVLADFRRFLEKVVEGTELLVAYQHYWHDSEAIDLREPMELFGHKKQRAIYP
ncbi:hypothetical protein LshimejAT787_2300170 [Lyophyllum shimeji]|uniref:Uncharacterized protein n=1 Tax=Lyophyllum shimeji TaxID=47721 RepID=A0A9P3PYL0_LYOSH|nr:hypothetical protein LshimejAT787_2300170 [Lyophyllum shimeji]